MQATVFDIKHFAVHDGPGIRTTVFFKGCPLRCVWCHNPESLSPRSELALLSDRCVGCQKCAAVCEHGVHVFRASGHVLSPENCTLCGACERACPRGALTLYGRSMTVAEVLAEVLEDRDFYGETGGVTLSGGECLLQAEFCAALLRELKKEGIHTAIDTAGFIARASLERVIDDTDLFLYDIKAMDREVHRRCTGQPNDLILENLAYLDRLGKPVEIRIPLVPDCNEAEIEAIGAYLATLHSLTGVRVLPYHRYAGSKYESLGLPCTLPDTVPTEADVERARTVLSSHGLHLL